MARPILDQLINSGMVPPGYIPLREFCDRHNIEIKNIASQVGARLKGKRIGGKWFVPTTSSIRRLPLEEQKKGRPKFIVTNGEV